MRGVNESDGWRAIAPESIQWLAHERSDTPIYVFHQGFGAIMFRSLFTFSPVAVRRSSLRLSLT